MKYFGCAYYPEYWGHERFEIDAKLMTDAGINLARIGEFAWSRMEPDENVYTFEWLHECVNILAEHDINVLMCTPTAAPPAWLTSQYPDTCLVRANGTRAIHGSRRHYCSTSPAYRSYSGTITRVLADEMSKHSNVIGWQLDNELGPEMGWCHCDNCQKRFRGWLKERYATLDNLNDCWKTGFWSMDYSEWNQIRLSDDSQGVYSSRNMDSKRFWSDITIEFAMEQAKIVREHCPDRIVTTNGMGPVYSSIDYYDLFFDLDVACDDLYFDISSMDGSVAAMNIFCSMKPGRPYWITETGSGALDHNKPPHPDQFKAWAWSSLAHGSEMHCVFRWRTCVSGQEQELQGILEHSGQPRHRYEAVKNCFTEMRDVCEKIGDMPLPEARVAIVLDYESIWAYGSARVGGDVDYNALVLGIHKLFYDRNVVTDFIPTDRDLSSYDLVILPSLVIVHTDVAERLATFVNEGGTILAIGQMGMRDCNDNYLMYPGPDHMQDLLGCEIQGGMYLKSHVEADEALCSASGASGRPIEVQLVGSLSGREISGSAAKWAADITLKGGKVLLAFTKEAYAGQPAIVGNEYGKGRTIYAAALGLDDAVMNGLVDEALSLADIESGPKTVEHVEVVTRGDVVFAVNHTPDKVEVRLAVEGEAVLGRYNARGIALLDGYGVCVIKK